MANIKYHNVDKDEIDWTFSEEGWNTCIGCTKCSEGCLHCYAIDRVYPWKLRMGDERYADSSVIQCFEDRLDIPRHWRKPRRIFVASLGDLFHPDVPQEFIGKVFKTMNDCPQHFFMVCTKRPERMAELSDKLEFTPNIWMGVTVENAAYKWRLDELRKVPSAVRFVYTEPLLGPIPDMNLDGIHLVVCGGESGPDFRFMQDDWARGIRDQCVAEDVAFFFKQHSGFRSHTDEELDGQIWHQYPLAPGLKLKERSESS